MTNPPRKLKVDTLNDNYVVNDEGCWLWQGRVDAWGYVGLWLPDEKRYTKAHRYMYEQKYGPIPSRLVLDHLCHGRSKDCMRGNACLHRSCINPDHLEPVASGVNILRGNGPAAQQSRRTHCIRGHEFAPDNIYWGKYGARRCKACSKLRTARLTQERRALKRLKEAIR